jgi:uncharacterized protein YecT (DUF1311 family)
MVKPITCCFSATLLVLLTVAPVHAAKADQHYSKAYTACQDKALSTNEIRGCISDEDGAWDKQLNTVYQALMALRSEAEKVKLRDDERAWLKRTAHKCDHAGDGEMGGTLQGVEIDQCNLDEKILRTFYLRGLH